MTESRSAAAFNVLRSLVLAGLAFVRTRRQLAVEILALRLWVVHAASRERIKLGRLAEKQRQIDHLDEGIDSRRRG